ncbi:helix-turn-helix domain-containing protein [Mycobacterium simiae]|uniref:Helix-turn-helix domain-containing protein n=1 Tax=Mycobacterium simiae TaxID=1784 RepID=A0A5B1B5N8_MYCSI|nr:XRE family transcriptional regulator [Mycobacterium simiae]KAA1242940.1 helix-turn-helix domain-containing protein [Mycobacterium simiae]
MTSLNEWLSKRPVDRVAVEERKARMLSDVRAYKLRELREALDLTQVDLACLMHVSQNSISKLERGDIDRTQVDTLRRYIEAIGGSLRIEVEVGDERFQIA